jgi:O-antigen/teichoic acid export membrane protein
MLTGMLPSRHVEQASRQLAREEAPLGDEQLKILYQNVVGSVYRFRRCQALPQPACATGVARLAAQGSFSLAVIGMRDTLNLFQRARSSSGLKFFRDLGVLTAGEVIFKVVGFLAFAYLARTLHPEGYGAVEYTVGLSVLFATLVDGGLGVVGVRRIARRPGDLPALAAQVPAARLGVALVSVPVMVSVAAPAIHDPAGRNLVWLFALSLLVAPWRQDWLLQAKERMGDVVLAQLLRVAVFTATVLIFVRGASDILAVGWAEMAGAAAMSLYCTARQHTKITPFRPNPPMAGFVGLVREGATVALGNAVWAANQYAPLLLVASLRGGLETAWLAAANRIVTSVLTFSNVYHFNLYPTIARATKRHPEELASVLSASFRVVAWAATAVALALTLLAEPLCVLLFGSTFERAGVMLAVMVWTVPVALLSGHARWSLVAAGHQAHVVWAQLAGLASIGAFGAPLVLSLGGAGAAVLSLAASGAVWLAAHMLLRRQGGTPPAIAITFAPAGLALGVIGASRTLGSDHWVGALGVLVFTAAAPLLDRKLLPDLKRLGSETRRGSPSRNASQGGPDL